MNWACMQCQSRSETTKPWCLLEGCDPSTKVKTFHFGHKIDDIEFFEVVSILPSGTVYKGEVKGEKSLIKVAHPTRNHRTNLEKEFAFLQQMQGTGGRFLMTLSETARPGSSERHTMRQIVAHDQQYSLIVLKGEDGETLADYLARNRIPRLEESMWIIMQLLNGIGMLHVLQKGHLALSPAHIFLVKEEEHLLPTLLDLGTLIDLDDSTALQEAELQSIIPPLYGAPECFGLDPAPHPASDLYSIGLILFEMVNGKPFRPGMLGSHAHAEQDIRSPFAPSELVEDPLLQDLFAAALSPDPNDRYQEAQQFYTACRHHFSAPPRSRWAKRAQLYAFLSLAGSLLFTLFYWMVQ